MNSMPSESTRPEETRRTHPPGVRCLRRDVDGRLWFHGPEGPPVAVRVTICFPWSDPGRYFSVRTFDGEEVWFVEDVATLDPPSREALLAVVEEAHFTFGVEAIESIRTEQELRVWQVRLLQGERAFVTKLDEWPRPLPDGGWLIRDLSGDLYRMPDRSALDPRSASLLADFIE